MFNESFIAQLKQVNISKNAEKTKDRVEELWKDMPKNIRNEILSAVDLKATSMYRVYRLGNISAKIVVAMAQFCDINPYYLTGESDDMSGYSEELLIDFLKEKGYGKLFDQQVKKASGRGRKRNADKAADTRSKKSKMDDNAAEIEKDDMDGSDVNDQDEPVMEMEKVSVDSDDILEDESAESGMMEQTVEMEVAGDEEIDELMEKDGKEVVKEAVREASGGESALADELICVYKGGLDQINAAQMEIIDSLTKFDMDSLLKALAIKAKAGGRSAEIEKMIRLLLIS